MYKYKNGQEIEAFTGHCIRDEATDTMYVHPTKTVLKQLGYMELVRPEPPQAKENQYITESYTVKQGKIHVVYTVADVSEEVAGA